MQSKDLLTQHIPRALLAQMNVWLHEAYGAEGTWDISLVKSVGPIGRQRQIMCAENDKSGLVVGLKTNSSPRQTRAEFDALEAMKANMPDSVTPLHLDPAGGFFVLEWINAPVLQERFKSGDREAATRDAGAWLARLHAATVAVDANARQQRAVSFPFWTGFGPVGRAQSRMRRRLKKMAYPKTSVMLHGDFHPGNLFDTPDGPVGFDRSSDLYGLQYFDVAKYLIVVHSLRVSERLTDAVTAGSEEADRKAFFEGYGPIPEAELPLYDLIEDSILFRKWRSAFNSGCDRYDLEMQKRGLLGPVAPSIRPLRLVARSSGGTEWITGPTAT